MVIVMFLLFQTEGTKLQKDLKAYVQAVKSECVCEVIDY